MACRVDDFAKYLLEAEGPQRGWVVQVGVAEFGQPARIGLQKCPSPQPVDLSNRPGIEITMFTGDDGDMGQRLRHTGDVEGRGDGSTRA